MNELNARCMHDDGWSCFACELIGGPARTCRFRLVARRYNAVPVAIISLVITYYIILLLLYEYIIV